MNTGQGVMQDFLLAGVVVRPSLNEIETAHGCERLPAKFMDVLVALAERPGVVCSKADLLARVWADPMVGDEALSHAIWVLRKTLRDDAKRPVFIETIPRRGYRLLPTPEPLIANVPLVNGSASPVFGKHREAIDAAPPLPSSASLPDAPTRPWQRPALGGVLVVALLMLAGVYVPQRPAVSDDAPRARAFQAGNSISSLAGDGNGALLTSEDGFLYALDTNLNERWRTATGSRWSSSPAVDNDTVYFSGADHHLYAIDLASGRERWRVDTGHRIYATPLPLADRVIVGDKEGTVRAIARDDRRILWQRDYEADVVGTVRSAGSFSVLTLESNLVVALDPANGREVWRRQMPGPLSELVALDENTLLLACEEGFLVALDAHDGRDRWRVALDGAGTQPVFDGQRIYAVGRFGNVLALRADDGHVLWQRQFELGDRLDPVILGDGLVVGLSDHRLGFVNRNSGQLLGTLNLPSVPVRLLGGERLLWLATQDGRAYRIEPEAFIAGMNARLLANGTLERLPATAPTTAVTEALREGVRLPEISWKVRVIGNAQDATPTTDGIAYVGDEAGVSAIDTQGRTRWRYALTRSIGTAPVWSAPRVLFGGRDHAVQALDAATGTSLWRFMTGADVISTPVIDRGRVFFGSNDRRFYSIRLEDGALLWSFDTQGPVHGAAAVAADRVVFGSGDSRIYALDATSGRELWRSEARDWVVAQPVIVGDRVFVGVCNGDFLALSLTSGTELWRVHSDGKIWFAPAAANGLVYFGSADGFIYALQQADGRERWRYRTGAPAEGSVVYRDGVIFAGSHDAHLYALDSADGSPLWRFRTGGSVWNPGLAGNTLLVPSADQHVYALGL